MVVFGDISFAVFWLVVVVIILGLELVIENVGVNFICIGILEVLEIMEVDIVKENFWVVVGEFVVDLWVCYSFLKVCEIFGFIIFRLIDEILILVVVVMFVEGIMVICDVVELWVKESDCLVVMVI